MDDDIPEDPSFNIDQYIDHGSLRWQWETHQTLTVEMMCSEWLVNILDETPINHDQLISKEKDKYKVIIKVVDNFEFRSWLLSHSEHIEVKSPIKLMNWLNGIGTDLIRKYATTNKVD